MFLSTTLVETGILYPATNRADLALFKGIPATSYKILPGFTTATQYSTLPLPDPMRVWNLSF